VVLTGSAMNTNGESSSSDKKHFNSAITANNNNGNIRWGFNIDDVNFQRSGIDMPKDILPTVRFRFIGKSNEPVPPPKDMAIAITSCWSITLPSEPKSIWIHKILRFFRSTGNTQSYSNLFQIVALKADLSESDLPGPSYYNATVKVRPGAASDPHKVTVKRSAAKSVDVTLAVVDDPQKLSAFNLPKIANFRLSKHSIPITENSGCDSKSH